MIGLLGLLDLEHHIIPNYTDPIQQLFVDATFSCIKARGDLRVLELVSCTPRTTPGMSSWAVDWVSVEGHMPRLPPYLRNIQKRFYDASRSQRAQYSASPDRRAITLKGILLGKITVLVPPSADMPGLDDTGSRRRLIEERLRLTGFEEPLSDTMLRGCDEYRNRQQCKPLLATAMTLMQGIRATLVDWYDRGKEDERLRTINQWVHEAEWRRGLQAAANGMVSHEWKDLEATLTTSTFFTTSDRRLGSCAAVTTDLSQGDRVAVLYGSDMPVLLRKVGGGTATSNGESDSCDDGEERRRAREKVERESFQFLGVAYVHGLMDGEALDLVGTGEARLGDITLV